MVRALTIALLLLALAGCTSIAERDPIAIKNSTDMKVESDALISKAVDPALVHLEEIEEVLLHGKQAYEYARIKTNNELTARQWEIMLDPERRMLGGFLRMWEERGRGYSEVFLLEVRGMIASGFDEIIRLEKAK